MNRTNKLQDIIKKHPRTIDNGSKVEIFVGDDALMFQFPKKLSEVINT